MILNSSKSVLSKKVVLIAFLAGISLYGCRRDVVDNVHPAPNQVFLQNIAYNPASLTVKVNTTVTWINKDDMDHTVTSLTNVFDSGVLHSGLSYSYTFTNTGTYPYSCQIHGPVMSGTIIVQ